MQSTIFTALSGLLGGLVGTLLYQWLVGQELDWVRGVFVGSGIAVVALLRKRRTQGAERMDRATAGPDKPK